MSEDEWTLIGLIGLGSAVVALCLVLLIDTTPIRYWGPPLGVGVCAAAGTASVILYRRFRKEGIDG